MFYIFCSIHPTKWQFFDTYKDVEERKRATRQRFFFTTSVLLYKPSLLWVVMCCVCVCRIENLDFYGVSAFNRFFLQLEVKSKNVEVFEMRPFLKWSIYRT
jgi:hypothetical protein